MVMGGRAGKMRGKSRIARVWVGVKCPALGTTGRPLPLSSRRWRVIGIREEVAASGVGSVSGGLVERVALVGE